MTPGDFDKASDRFERAHEHRESTLFIELYSKEFGVQQAAFQKYRMTPRYKALVQKPPFREWQAEHDRIADHRDSPN